MRLSEVYGLVALIFARQFHTPVIGSELAKLCDGWPLITQNKQCEKGLKLFRELKTALSGDGDSENAAIKTDLEAFKEAVNLSYFSKTSDDILIRIYAQIGFKAPFENIKPSHISAVLTLYAAIFKNDLDELKMQFLGYFLNETLPSVMAFAVFIKSNAKSLYFQALGEFLADFANTLNSSLNINVDLSR